MIARWVGLSMLACAACHHETAKPAPDAAAPVASHFIVPPEGGISPEQLAKMIAEANDAGCPAPIHPGYCRHRCRNFSARTFSMHARRIRVPRRAGKGTCGPYLVFTEEALAEDGGAAGGIVEYYDATTKELVGAEDSRAPVCGSFGTIPKCKLEIQWGPRK